MNYQAELIAVGTELLGNIANTDAQRISRLLSAAGVDVLFHTVVGDNAARLEEVTDIARKRANLLIYIGGLGPTYDDITRDVVCRAFGRAPVFHPEILAEIQHYFDTVFRRPMPVCNRQQAYLPQDCEIFHNAVGTAPGCVFEANGVTVILVPGVPHECFHMMEHQVLPWLCRRSGQMILSHDIRTFGLNEPQIQEMLGSVMNEAANPSLAPYAQSGEVLVRITAKGENEAACRRLMAPVLDQVRAVLGQHIYGENVGSLEEVVIHLLREQHLTCATAESLTGGLIAKRLTDVPGASSVFLGGVVSYTNGVKAGVLGVPQTLLDTYGAVSQPVAAAMAEGARNITGADLAVAVTGVAGPDKDDRGNEVGTVYLGLATPKGTTVRQLALGGDRAAIRTMTAQYALDSIRRYIAGLNN